MVRQGRGAPEIPRAELTKRIGIKQRREELGISQAELARRVGIKQPSLHNIEIGQTKKSSYMPEICEQLGLDFKTGKPLPEAGSAKFAQNTADKRQSSDFPVYLMHPRSSGEGMVLTAEPTEYVSRPSLLSTVPEAFGICVWGDSNYPAYKAGDIVFVHPYQPPVIGTDVVLRPTDVDDMSVYIGELQAETAKEWSVKPYNGDQSAFSKSKWRCDRIVGKYNRR